MPKEIIKTFLRKKLAWGCVVVALTSILGSLPALDFLPAVYLKFVSFALGVLLTIAKAIEMFFEQSAQIEQQDSTGDTEIRQLIKKFGDGPTP